MSEGLAGRAAIVGIGATEFSKASGRRELQLALEATKAAIDDAGLEPADVDGMVTFTMESNEETAVARGLGIPKLTHFSRVHFGGGAAGGRSHGEDARSGEKPRGMLGHCLSPVSCTGRDGRIAPSFCACLG